MDWRMSNTSDPFTEMAARILLNEDQGFGGAFVIVPPGEEPKPRVMLMLDNAENPAMFWSSLQTVCGIALKELEQEETQAAGFGMMGRR
jgi:hypothetical protein